MKVTLVEGKCINQLTSFQKWASLGSAECYNGRTSSEGTNFHIKPPGSPLKMHWLSLKNILFQFCPAKEACLHPTKQRVVWLKTSGNQVTEHLWLKLLDSIDSKWFPSSFCPKVSLSGKASVVPMLPGDLDFKALLGLSRESCHSGGQNKGLFFFSAIPLSQYSQPIWYLDLSWIEIDGKKQKNLWHLGSSAPRPFSHMVWLLFCLFACLVRLESYTKSFPREEGVFHWEAASGTWSQWPSSRPKHHVSICFIFNTVSG